MESFVVFTDFCIHGTFNYIVKNDTNFIPNGKVFMKCIIIKDLYLTFGVKKLFICVNSKTDELCTSGICVSYELNHLY